MLKERIAIFLNNLLKECGETQEGLASMLGVTKSSLQGYLKGRNKISVDVLIKMAEIGGVSLDTLVYTDKPEISVDNSKRVNISNSNGVNVAGRDININPRITRKTTYSPGPEDISGEQAAELKELVDEVVELEKKCKQKPKTHGALWNSLNRKMGVTYYREIKNHQFDKAVLYLKQWKGRLNKSLKRTDKDMWRKKTFAAIFAIARNELGWTKDYIDSYIFERYKKESIRDLNQRELMQLYNVMHGMKKKT